MQRTVQDIGAVNNRKSQVEPYSPRTQVRDPIIKGDFSKVQRQTT